LFFVAHASIQKMWYGFNTPMTEAITVSFFFDVVEALIQKGVKLSTLHVSSKFDYNFAVLHFHFLIHILIIICM
jgi:hypothetical protein